jgi:hypothetical protein
MEVGRKGQMGRVKIDEIFLLIYENRTPKSVAIDLRIGERE